MVLIDSSVWIFALKKNYHQLVRSRVDELLAGHDVLINGMIAVELLAGTKTDEEFGRLKKRLDALHYIDANRPLWDRSAHLAYALKKAGITAPYGDVFIAATAIQESATLVHADEHFDIIAKHSNLKVESFALSV